MSLDHSSYPTRAPIAERWEPRDQTGMDSQHFSYLRLLQVSGADIKPNNTVNWDDVYNAYQKCVGKGFQSEHAVTSAAVTSVLLQIGYDPTVDDNKAITLACNHGRTDVVRLLLADGRANPGVQESYPLALACNHSVELIHLLLSDERVDPSACDNRAIRVAASWGSPDVVRLLLSDKRVNARASDNDALQRARHLGRTEIVRLLEARAC